MQRLISLAACACAAALALSACQRQAQCTSESRPAPAMEWEDPLEVASGEAHRGPWRMNDSEWRFVDDATVALNDAGVVAIAWADHERQDIFLQVFEPEGDRRFDEPANLSRSPSIFSWLPRLELSSGKGEAIDVVWQEIVFSGGSHGGEIFYARSTDGGKRFGDPQNLSSATAGAGKGRLTSERWDNGSFDALRGPGGALYVAWTEYEGRLWLRRSEGAGEGFGDALLLAGGDERGERPARGPSLARTPDGELHLAYTLGEDPGADIHILSSRDGGQSFGEARAVAPSDAHADAPQIAASESGALHLVYAEGDRGPFGAHEIRYARKDPGEESFSSPHTIAGGTASELASAHYPALATAPGDRLYVLWERYPSLGKRPRGLGFALSEDGGEAFSKPSLVPGSMRPELGVNGSQQGLLSRKLAASEGGAIAVANSTFARGEASHIWLHRARPSD